MSIAEDGKIGEAILREYFKDIGVEDVFQADWIVKFEGKYRLIEAKYQEIYTPPPFYGHGLPPRQIKARLNFYTETRIEPYLFIIEKSDYEKKDSYHLIWHQSFIALELGEYKDTAINPRRIYNISSFKKIYYPKIINRHSYNLLEQSKNNHQKSMRIS